MVLDNHLKKLPDKLIQEKEIKILVWNSRSIRSVTKRTLLIDVLTRNEVHIALIQETFLIKEDPLYIRGWRIFRADGMNRRKGVCIMVRADMQWSVCLC